MAFLLQIAQRAPSFARCRELIFLVELVSTV